MPTVDNCKLIDIKTITDRGKLGVIEFYDLPFIPKRVFYIYDVNDLEVRGNHAHYRTQQFLICLQGECGVGLFDGNDTQEVHLNNPEQGLFIPEMVWDSQLYSKDAVLVVLASTHYNPDDYITDYDEFKRLSNATK